MPASLKSLHYGWVMVIISAVILFSLGLTLFPFGVFLEPITEELDWARGPMTLAFSISTLLAGVFGIVTGRLSDRFGPRPLVIFAGISTGVSFLLMSRISELWHVYLIWGLLVSTAVSCCFAPIKSTVARWFNSNRGMAISLTVVGFGAGGIVWPIVCRLLIDSYGWRQAYVIMGFIAFVAFLIPAMFLKHSPQRAGLKPYGYNAETKQNRSRFEAEKVLTLKEAAGTGHFWLFGAILFFHMFCIQTISVHIVPSATDIGIEATVAAGILSSFAAVSLFGQVATGYIADKIGNRKILVINLGIAMLALLLLPLARNTWSLYLVVSLLGTTGGIVPLQPLLAAELFGLKSVGVILAGIMFFGTIGSAIGPTLAGYIIDNTGSYNPAFLTCAAFGVMAFMLGVFLLPRRKSTIV